VHAWLTGTQSPEVCARLEDGYDSFVYEDCLQRIRQDCQDPRIEPILSAASLGAFFAVSGLFRHPDVFRLAIGMSGVYDLSALRGAVSSQKTGAFSLIEYLSNLTGPQLERLRHRKVILGSGQGDYETPAESQRLTDVLATKAVPCKLSLWGPARDHTWSTWREMLPAILAEQL
jgi:esterase/lipase superfamily enzyme